PGLARVRARVAGILGRAPGRARRDVAACATAPRAEAERLHPRTTVFPEHPAPRGRTVAAPGHRGPRGGHPDVRDRLSTLGQLVSQVGGGDPRLDHAVRDGPPKAPLGERAPVLSPLRVQPEVNLVAVVLVMP